jgi:isopentenyldiphosphate isomerase
MKFLDVVNDEDEVLAYASIRDVYLKNIPHRVSHVFIFNDKGEIALQKRSSSKDFCPKHWCSFVATHVEEKESYKSAAERKFKNDFNSDFFVEEAQKFLFHKDNIPKKFIMLFKGSSEGPFDFNKEKIESIEFFSPEKIKEMIKSGEKFHPEFLFLFESYFPNKN